MTSAEALQKIADAAKAVQSSPKLKHPSTRFACVCLTWAPKWVEDKGHRYTAGYLAALYGSNRFLPEPLKMHDTITSALWMASELLDNGFHTTDAPADQVDQLVEAIAELEEDDVLEPA